MKTTDQAELGHNGPQFSSECGTSPGIFEFQQMVLSHYEQYDRKMAWLTTVDPYRILVS